MSHKGKRKLKWIYDVSALLEPIKGDGSPFMNLGYHGDDLQLELDEKDESWRLHLHLYHKLLGDLEQGPKSVLETGCGRGGGVYYLKKYLSAERVIGTDMSSGNIRICKKYFGELPDTEFQTLEAEHLDLADDFDLIVSMESYMFYADKARFLKLASEHLQVNGILAIATPTNPNTKQLLESLPSQFNLHLHSEEDITIGVLDAIRLRYANQKTPASRKRKNFEVSPDSDNFKKYEHGERHYMIYRFQKKDDDISGE